MAAAEAASGSDAGAQMSEALRNLLAAEAEQQAEHRRAASVQSSGADTASEHAPARSQGSADVDLGQLDITSSDVSLDGLDEQLDKFADHEVVRAILDQGCDPKQYRQQYEEKLRAAEMEAIQDYIAENENLVTLHREISACDSILAGMESMLGGFQEGLGSISAEIRGLQQQSAALSLQLNNRKAAQGRLANFIDNIVIPGPLIHGIVQGEVNEEWLGHLEDLHNKLEFVRKSKLVQASAAHQDVQPELERLRVKAVAKAREYLMARIYALRKPKTNIQILQQNMLLRFRYLVTFLRAHGPEVFGEVRTAYIDTLSRVLSSHFRAYLHALDGLKEAGPTQADVVGAAEAPREGVMSLFGKAASDTRAEVFSLGERGNILLHLEGAALIPHIVQAEGKKFPGEVLFRSVNKLLMDTATSEYLFCADFFGEDAVFHELFGPTLSAVESHLSTTVQEMYDMVGLLLMIRINYQHRLLMNKRRIPCLDDYLDRVNLQLWPRFKSVFDMQLASLKNYPATAPSTKLDVHPVAARYAQLTASLLLLNADYQDGQLDHNIGRMRYQTMDLLIKMSRLLQHKKLGTTFLVVNFHHVCLTLREAAQRGGRPSAEVALPEGTAANLHAVAGALGALGMDTLKEFEDQLTSCTGMYVEEALSGHFQLLLNYVQKAEHARKAQGLPEGQAPEGFGPKEAAPIIRDFAARWTSALEALHREVLKDFNKSPCGKEVANAAMSQLMGYYSTALDLIKRAGPEGAGLARDAVTVPSIMYEVRRKTKS